MSNKILGILEHREGKLKKVSFEVLSVVARLASELNLESGAIVVGNNIDNLDEAFEFGIDKIYHLKNENLYNYSPSGYNDVISDYAKELQANYLIFPNTSFGKDIAPRISVRLNAGCLVDCINIEISNGEFIATRPVYAGKALLDVKLKSEIKIITIRPNVFKPNRKEKSASSSLIVKDVVTPNIKTHTINLKKSEGKLDVAEADIIVSGGRGLKEPENFYLVENLADALGGAVGASRAVVDAGWRPHTEQVGQTGKTVSPSLYVACGISGAIQHLAGMSSSKYIVAINKDKDAPIFSVADYGIAGDVLEILPKLTEEIKKIKS